MSLWEGIKEKLNPAQRIIAEEEGSNIGSTQTKLQTTTNAYKQVEVVNRCVNLLVDNSSLIEFDVGNSLPFTARKPNTKAVTLSNLLNYRPNPYMDTSTFRRLLMMDFLIDGNCFIYFDGTGLYHLPADNVEIFSDSKGYISHFVYGGEQTFSTNEIIFVKDNSIKSVYRGDSRILSSMDSLLNRESMVHFQKKFFDNGASIGLILETEQILSKKLKDRQEREWMVKYNPRRGSGKPMILDAGLKAKSVSNTNMREMAFSESVTSLEEKICVALGIPPILLNSGNNANIKPNLELLFYTTVIPMMRKFESAFELFFAFDIQLATHRVPALMPDMKSEAERISALVNNGIITGNEGREILRLKPIEDKKMSEIRIPANVAGSATGVEGQEGGKPSTGE